MLAITMTAVLLVGTSSDSWHCGHRKNPQECSVCEDESPEVARQIARLQSGGWIGRRKAARALRVYDWKSHPEAAEALAESLTRDDCKLVRQEAAESLARMRPCLPTVHEAVARAARCDDSLLARHWARKALKAMAKSCVEPCSLCGEGESPHGPDTWLESSTVLRRESRLVAPPPAIVPIPDESSGPSPFDPRNSPSLPPIDPVRPGLSVPAPGEAPPLESPALP
ncbi:MAG: HEAT repeat domain-containing protein [Isosphaeraceae bacterium]